MVKACDKWIREKIYVIMNSWGLLHSLAYFTVINCTVRLCSCFVLLVGRLVCLLGRSFRKLLIKFWEICARSCCGTRNDPCDLEWSVAGFSNGHWTVCWRLEWFSGWHELHHPPNDGLLPYHRCCSYTCMVCSALVKVLLFVAACQWRN